MRVKFFYFLSFPTVWLLLLLPMGCDSDDDPADGGQMVDGAPILIGTIPSNLGTLSSSGTLYMIFSVHRVL